MRHAGGNEDEVAHADFPFLTAADGGAALFDRLPVLVDDLPAGDLFSYPDEPLRLTVLC